MNQQLKGGKDLNLKLTAPSKTFFMGEYLALEGGPSLVVATEPRFELRVDLKGSGSCQGIHPQSPAGLWVRQKSEIFRRCSVEFIDPHDGHGGLGASSAQFAMVYILSRLIQCSLENWPRAYDAENLWRSYLTVAWDGRGRAPSGADVMGQLVGGVSEFSKSPFVLNNGDWPFEEYDFLVVPTGHKLPTHKHLKEVKAFNPAHLRPIMLSATDAFERVDAPQLIEAINAYHEQLKSAGLVTDHSLALIDRLKEWPEVKAIKGCGALGADTLMLVCERKIKNKLCGLLADNQLAVLASSENICSGIQVEVDLSSGPHRKSIDWNLSRDLVQ